MKTTKEERDYLRRRGVGLFYDAMDDLAELKRKDDEIALWRAKYNEALAARNDVLAAMKRAEDAETNPARYESVANPAKVAIDCMRERDEQNAHAERSHAALSEARLALAAYISAHLCRTCYAGTHNGWQHNTSCSYSDSLRRIDAAPNAAALAEPETKEKP